MMSSLRNRSWHWALSRQWHQARLPWLAWALSVFAGLAAVAASSAWIYLQQRQLADARRGLVALQARPAPPAPSAPTEPEADFARRLPPETNTATWVNDLQRAAAQLGVTVVSVTDAPRTATPTLLGRHDLQLTLRGAYPQIKLVLKELLDRHAGSSVNRLNFRTMTNPGDVEASVSVTRWSRPLPSPAPAASGVAR
ncbi:hypothetical protein FHT26_005701 [Rhizobacter sp. SG703]|nr:hypothetical protein [Rhizobacter sp. SG703]